jgi:hypothetical protein
MVPFRLLLRSIQELLLRNKNLRAYPCSLSVKAVKQSGQGAGTDKKKCGGDGVFRISLGGGLRQRQR